MTPADGDGATPLVGVDEAGKGPVVGSMFVAAVRAPTEALPDGIDDSKRLTDDRREALADRLRDADRIDVAVVECQPAEIDDTNMNDLTVAAHAAALDGVAVSGETVLCDAGDVDAGRFADRVAAAASLDVSVAAEHGADGSDDLVGAASIIAKSARERHVEQLSEQYGAVGSGYPSDPTTKAFLREAFEQEGGFPPCVRTSWSTCERIRAEAEQTDLDGF